MWEPCARAPGGRPDPAPADCSRLRGGASGTPLPQPLPEGSCEETRLAERREVWTPGALGSANHRQPLGGSVVAAATGLRGRPGTDSHAAPKAPEPLEAAPGPRRSCPCHCSLALDAATSRWGRRAPGYSQNVSACGLRPAAACTPGVRAVVPLPAESPGKLHLCRARENLPNFREPVPPPRRLLNCEMAAPRQLMVSSATSQEAKVAGNRITYGEWDGQSRAGLCPKERLGGERERLLSGRHS